MTEDRERELLRHVPTINCTEEMDNFREGIRSTDGEMTATLFQALMERAEYLRRKA